ncbi:MAG: hypothetical protein M9899_00285 [Bdellovibrionaceae bacterium]|nr:hypothetical protein [Pseudobdellovibrionaceae bacterium]
MTKIIRLVIYISTFVILLIAVSIHKKSIIASKEAIPPSILGTLIEKGAPVVTYEVKHNDIQNSIRVSLEKCGNNNYCFFTTAANSRALKSNAPIYDANFKQVVGKVNSISGLDPLSGLSRVNVALTISDSEFKKSKFNIVSVRTELLKNVLSVPTSSVSYDNESSFVWLFNNGAPKKQPVKIGTQNNIFTEIKSGLKSGDVVVAEGAGLLSHYEKARSLSTFEPNKLN